MNYYDPKNVPPIEDFRELSSIENLRQMHDVLYEMQEDAIFYKMMSYMVKTAMDSLQARDKLIDGQKQLIKKQEEIIHKLANDLNITEDNDIPEDYRWD